MRTSLLEQLLKLKPVIAEARHRYPAERIIKRSIPGARVEASASKVVVRDDHEACIVTLDKNVEVWLAIV